MSKKMSKSELVTKLNKLAKSDDPAQAHEEADALLLFYIKDVEVLEAFKNIKKWYS